jgi:anti-sigma-K factor RskA
MRLVQPGRNSFSAVGITEARQPRAWFPIWVWAGATALIAFAVFSLWQAHRMQMQLAELTARLKAGEAQRQKLAEERAIAERTNLILSDPASRRVTLRARTGPQVHAFCHPKLGIIVYGGSVPMPASNRTYQLWLVMKDKNAKPMSAAMFRPDAWRKVMLMVPAMPADMDAAAALAISEEPSGGSPQPTSAPIWAGPLT